VPSLIYYGNESKATILTENTETKTPQSPVTDETDNRPWYWIPFKLCLRPALRYNHLGFGYYVQNLGLTMKTSGYTRVYCG
jgi:hypothetical protein